ncbi:MAG: hypothetical protein ACRDAM_16125, partial [Casimicrobium sp.]
SLFVPILAFCGAPQARTILKVDQLQNKPVAQVARNVAWDFRYFAYREISYARNKYSNDVICTADHALAELLLMKMHHGPRLAPELHDKLTDIPSFGEFFAFHCPRIQGSPKLATAIESRVTEMWRICNRHPELVRVGFNNTLGI